MRTLWIAALTLGLVAAGLATQVPADPLTRAEARQVQGTAGSLDQRVKLLAQFAQDRLNRFEKIRTASAGGVGRGQQLYLLLRQYEAILPELNDAMDDVASQLTTSESRGKKYNVPKVAGELILKLEQMQATLHHIQTSSSAADLASYHFELQDCLDATSDSLQNAQEAESAKPSGG